MTLAIGHREGDSVIVDAIREAKPPLSPEQTVETFSAVLKNYNNISEIGGDKYAGEWPREQFSKHGITYEPCAKPKSDLYRDALPLLNSGLIDLLDHAKLVNQFVGLERRTARGGKDSIDHPPGPRHHDDIANAVAGVIAACKQPTYDSSFDWVNYDVGDEPDPDADGATGWRRARLQAYLLSGGTMRFP